MGSKKGPSRNKLLREKLFDTLGVLFAYTLVVEWLFIDHKSQAILPVRVEYRREIKELNVTIAILKKRQFLPESPRLKEDLQFDLNRVSYAWLARQTDETMCEWTAFSWIFNTQPQKRLLSLVKQSFDDLIVDILDASMDRYRELTYRDVIKGIMTEAKADICVNRLVTSGRFPRSLILQDGSRLSKELIDPVVCRP